MATSHHLETLPRDVDYEALAQFRQLSTGVAPPASAARRRDRRGAGALRLRGCARRAHRAARSAGLNQPVDQAAVEQAQTHALGRQLRVGLGSGGGGLRLPQWRSTLAPGITRGVDQPRIRLHCRIIEGISSACAAALGRAGSPHRRARRGCRASKAVSRRAGPSSVRRRKPGSARPRAHQPNRCRRGCRSRPRSLPTGSRIR